MAFDPKVLKTTRAAPRAAPKTATPATVAEPATTAAASGHSSASEFDRAPTAYSEGRRAEGGVADDSVGRTKAGGVADDSVGERDPAMSAELTRAQRAARDARYAEVENPSYLAASSRPAPAKLSLHQMSAQVTAVLGARRAAPLLAAAKAATVGSRLSALLLGLGALPANVGKSLLTTFAASPEGVSGAVLSSLVSSGALQQLTGADQLKLATVLGTVGEKGARLLGALVERRPSALTTQDSKGGTLVSNLAQLAGQPLNANLSGKTTSDELLSEVLLDVVNPDRVDQGTAPTCTVASMQYELVSDEPSEYARLMAGLTGPTGKAEMRLGGNLELMATDANPAALDARSLSQALFQTAAMEYGNGRDADFDPISGKSQTSAGDTFRGLKPAQQTQVLRQLFGVSYRSESFYTEAQGEKALEALRGYDARAARNRPVILQIDQGPINHAVALEKIADGRVFFRDPYGALRSMPEGMFPKYVVAVNRPTDLQIH